MTKNLPTSATVFKGVFAVHLLSAVWNIIGDCDETFNYWEPLHFLIYGNGFQTWEYAPQYGLRSYAYTWLYGAPAFLANRLLGLNGRVLFYLIRVVMALFASAVETYLYTVLSRRFRSISSLSVLTTIFLSFSAGSFIACTAFLPSSFAMYLSTAMLASWLDKNYKMAVACVASSAIVGWPFSAALGVPLAFDLIIARRRLCACLRYTFQAGVLFTVPVVVIDSFYYGQLVLAPLNILKYNVFSEHGPELYGTEPFDYYLRNYILNFNIVFLLYLSIPLVVFLIGKQDCISQEFKQLVFALSPSLVWNGIFFLQPHKEERFLYPVYPFIAVGAALSLYIVATFISRIFKNRLGSSSEKLVFNGLQILVTGVFLMFSAGRIMALIAGYSAPMGIYSEFTQPDMFNNSSHKGDNTVFVCVGREWYRFPSHFFLHTESPLKLRLKFIQSEFRGQLPAEYDNTSSNATRLHLKHFNDANLEDKSRYWPIDKCDYLIDIDTPDKATKLEPNYSEMKNWKIIHQKRFILSQSSPVLHRAFYIPFLFTKKNTFVPYVILKRIL